MRCEFVNPILVPQVTHFLSLAIIHLDIRESAILFSLLTGVFLTLFNPFIFLGLRTGLGNDIVIHGKLLYLSQDQ